ncbi:10370_t:CDS:2, partial [Entrophospora sp. SA101]
NNNNTSFSSNTNPNLQPDNFTSNIHNNYSSSSTTKNSSGETSSSTKNNSITNNTSVSSSNEDDHFPSANTGECSLHSADDRNNSASSNSSASAPTSLPKNNRQAKSLEGKESTEALKNQVIKEIQINREEIIAYQKTLLQAVEQASQSQLKQNTHASSTSQEKGKGLTPPQLAELNKAIETEFDIKGGTFAPAAQKVDEQKTTSSANVSLKVLEIGKQPVQIYGAVKDIINKETGRQINIINAKQIIDQKKPILENIPKARAEEYKKQLEGKKEEERGVKFKDYNNQIRLEILTSRWEEPKFSEFEVYRKKITWNQKLFLTCQKETKLGIKLKFLNTGTTFDLTQVLAEIPFSPESLLSLFGQEEIIENSLQLGKSEKKTDKAIPRFLFDEKNSYFLLGKLGRQKFNRKMNVLLRLSGQTLAEDLKDKTGQVIFPAGTVLSEEEISTLQNLIQGNRLPLFTLENYQFYSFTVTSPLAPQKKINVLGSAEKDNKDEEKDSLENQVIRRVGDLLYNIFDNKFGVFKQEIEKKHLFTISQLNKAEPTKLPKIQEFNKVLKTFFHSSTLVQLQNENNPLAEVSHIRKVSSLGLGGFNLTNVSPGIRNINPSYYGRYCSVETPEGQKVGLIHNLTLNAKVDKYGQALAPYYLVKQGKITPEIVYLTAEEELEKYITHCNIKINENNLIEEDKI